MPQGRGARPKPVRLRLFRLEPSAFERLQASINRHVSELLGIPVVVSELLPRSTRNETRSIVDLGPDLPEAPERS